MLVKTFFVIARKDGLTFYVESYELTDDVLVAEHFLTEEGALLYKRSLPNSEFWFVKKIEINIV